MTKEDLEKYIEVEDKLEEISDTIFSIALKEFPEQFGNFLVNSNFLESIEVNLIGGYSISFRFEEYYGDYSDSHTIEVPFASLLDLALFKKEQQEAREKYISWKENREDTKKKEKAQRERKNYERLKQKYETGESN